MEAIPADPHRADVADAFNQFSSESEGNTLKAKGSLIERTLVGVCGKEGG